MGSDGSIALTDLASDEAADPERVTVGGIGAPALLEGEQDQLQAKPVTVSLARPGDKDLPTDVPAELLAGLGPTEVLVSYRIDPAWLADPARLFPVVLDPVACIGNGTSGSCGTPFLSSGAFDEFVFSYDQDSYDLPRHELVVDR